jgi:hypothetical protein
VCTCLRLRWACIRGHLKGLMLHLLDIYIYGSPCELHTMTHNQSCMPREICIRLSPLLQLKQLSTFKDGFGIYLITDNSLRGIRLPPLSFPTVGKACTDPGIPHGVAHPPSLCGPLRESHSSLFERARRIVESAASI